MLDLDVLLQAISPGKPCGEDYEENEKRSRMPIRMVESFFVEALNPARADRKPKGPDDWRTIERQCEGVFCHESKSLFVAVTLTVVQLQLRGLAGFAHGLELIHGLLVRYWDDLFPPRSELRRRGLTLGALSDPYEGGEPYKVFYWLSIQPLFHTAKGTITAEHVQQFADDWDKAPRNGGSLNELEREKHFSVLREAARQTEPATRKSTEDAFDKCLKNVSRIEGILGEKMPDDAPDWSALKNALQRMRDQFTQCFSPLDAPSEGEPAPLTEAALPSPSQTVEVFSPLMMSEPAFSEKQKVLRSIEAACAYFELHEPSSPVPLLLRRAQQLVGKSFEEIFLKLDPTNSDPIKRLVWDDKKPSA